MQRPPSLQPIPPDARKVFEGELFSVFQWEVTLFDGTTALFEKVQRPDTVLVLPVLDDGRIVLTRQEQPGRAPFISAIGGRVEQNEDILAAASRELMEEAGYTAAQYQMWYSMQPTIKVDWAIYTFIARNVEIVDRQLLDAGERVDLLPLGFDEFLNLANDPDFIEVEMIPRLVEARYVPEKGEMLKALLGIK